MRLWGVRERVSSGGSELSHSQPMFWPCERQALACNVSFRQP